MAKLSSVEKTLEMINEYINDKKSYTITNSVKIQIKPGDVVKVTCKSSDNIGRIGVVEWVTPDITPGNNMVCVDFKDWNDNRISFKCGVYHESDVELISRTTNKKPMCECGSDKVGSSNHSYWCPKME